MKKGSRKGEEGIQEVKEAAIGERDRRGGEEIKGGDREREEKDGRWNRGFLVGVDVGRRRRGMEESKERRGKGGKRRKKKIVSRERERRESEGKEDLGRKKRHGR